MQLQLAAQRGGDDDCSCRLGTSLIFTHSCVELSGKSRRWIVSANPCRCTFNKCDCRDRCGITYLPKDSGANSLSSRKTRTSGGLQTMTVSTPQKYQPPNTPATI